ncbi:glutamate mutase L [Ornithinimicrobium sp. Arc0846-15]|nr:glutamate mutase L [Ornithinimicrobium laminariae]
MNLLCVDVGSTFTKACLVSPTDGQLLARSARPTTSQTDVLVGMQRARQDLVDQGHQVPDLAQGDDVYVCSSAGGGLRLAVVGFERQVTAEAGHRVGLSAGAKVVHIFAGRLSVADVAALRADRPDVILLVGGTNGGNSEVLLHNARRLATSRVGAAIVAAGNDEAAQAVAEALTDTQRRFVMADNVLPKIGEVAPTSARSAIRVIFLRHVIGGKGLSKGPLFASLVQAATPDAVLTGAENLGSFLGEDIVIADVGGATTDVYSVLQPEGEDATLRKHVVAPLWQSRTVEGDLGMRWSAATVLEAAQSEGMSGAADAGLVRWVGSLREHTDRIPESAQEQGWDAELARLALTLAVRRHGRPANPAEGPRPLMNVKYLIGSGGALRHAPSGVAKGVISGVLADHGGGWRTPTAAIALVDEHYLLAALGLIGDQNTGVSRGLATQIMEQG